MSSNPIKIIAMAALLGSAATAVAAPVDVSFSVTGSSGNWVYDFTIKNNLTEPTGVYFFGVQIGQTNVTGSPAAWGFADWDIPWSNADEGGSSIVYDNVWCCATYVDNVFTGITPGQSLGGFEVTSNAATALTSIPWFAYGLNGQYFGPHFGSEWNPGFEGVAGAADAPEPVSWMLMVGGFGAVGGALRARRKTSISFA